MSAAEHNRAARYRFSEDRERYIAGRATLKRALSERAGIPAADLIIEEADWTKPKLVLPAGAPPIFFNVSHSGDYALVALSDSVEVGIDIELVRADCPIDDLARRYYSAREHQRLRKLSSAARLRDFYRLWTIKESVLKCAGLGLSVPPAVVEVQLADDADPQIHSLDTDRAFLEQVSVREFAIADGYSSALAVESRTQIQFNII